MDEDATAQVPEDPPESDGTLKPPAEVPLIDEASQALADRDCIFVNLKHAREGFAGAKTAYFLAKAGTEAGHGGYEHLEKLKNAVFQAKQEVETLVRMAQELQKGPSFDDGFKPIPLPSKLEVPNTAQVKQVGSKRRR